MALTGDMELLHLLAAWLEQPTSTPHEPEGLRLAQARLDTAQAACYQLAGLPAALAQDQPQPHQLVEAAARLVGAVLCHAVRGSVLQVCRWF